MNPTNQKTLLSIVFIVLLGIASVFLLPWRLIDWGRVSWLPASTVTVTGEARSKEKTQVASFSAGVNAINDNKEAAVSEVNKKVAAIIAAAKTFGVPEADIKTQSINISQNEEQYYEDGRQKYRQGQWRVGNTVELTLRDVDRASEFAEVLSAGGANYVYGPNFTLDNTVEAENALLKDAIDAARTKASLIAKGANRKLGSVLTIAEGGSGNAPVFMARSEGGGGGGGGIEPGTGTVYKTVTVTFELR